MDVRQLEYFLAVVDHGGFNRAASALYLSQPSLSQSVRALERDLGSELFHRIGRRAVLTEAGTALIEPARTAVRSLQLARASVESVHGLRTGRVDIAATPSQAIEPLTAMISRFAERHPQVSVVVQAAFTPRDATEMVRTGVSELGLLATPGPLPTGEVRAYPVAEQRFVLITPPDGPFPAGTVSVRQEELAGRRLIVGQRGSGMRAYVEGLRTAGVALTVAVETEHRVAILPLVLSGVGVSVVTDAWRAVAERAGARVLEIEPATGLRIGLISRRTALTPAARAFLECALPRSQPAGPPPDAVPATGRNDNERL
ncbi:LysR family transcriptional regulator [Streptomyces sp. NPDC012623]|uniref:LysR family transcriptional regulator n=1 Tax=unclassified Streptomyces TaxID=2593676 RepID=UPI0036BA6CC7